MASYTISATENGVHKTLVASTIDTVTFSSTPARRVEVVNRDGTAEIYFTTDGTTPVVAANNTFVLPAAIGSYVTLAAFTGEIIKLISTGTPAYSVQGII